MELNDLKFSDLVEVKIKNTECDQHSPNLVLDWTFHKNLVRLMRSMSAQRAYIAVVPGTFRTPEQVRESNGHLTEEQLTQRRSRCTHSFEVKEGENPVTCDNCKDLPPKACTCDDCRDGQFHFRYDDIAILPLDKQTGLVQLHRPDNYIIAMALVLSTADKRFEKGEVRASVKCYMSNHEGYVLWKMEPGWCECHNILPNSIHHAITVDSSLFATPVSSWRMWWAELWLGKMKNGCQHFWSQFFTYPIQGPIIAIWILLRSIIGIIMALWLFLTGWRHTTLVPLIHPFKLDILNGDGSSPFEHSAIKGINSDQRYDPKGSFVQYTNDGVKRGVVGMILHAPIFWIGLACLCGMYHKYPKQMTKYALIGVALTLCISLVVLIVRILIKQADARPRVQHPPQMLVRYERLIQSTETRDPHNQPVRLWRRYIDAKAKGCLPFAQ